MQGRRRSSFRGRQRWCQVLVDVMIAEGPRHRLRLSNAAGETEEQFQRTVALVREVGFDRVNTAAYSPRPNTPAAVEEEQVSPAESMPAE